MNRRAALAALHVSVALFGFAALFGKWIALPATSIVLGPHGDRSAHAWRFRRWRARANRARRRAARGQRRDPGAALGRVLCRGPGGERRRGLLGYASFPVFVLLLDGRPRRGATLPAWGTAALAVAGLLALASEFLVVRHVQRKGLHLGVVSAITFAWLTLRNRALVAGGSPMRIALWQNVFAAACLLPIVAAGGGWTARPTAVTFASLVVLGVVCTGFAHTLFIASMRRVSRAFGECRRGARARVRHRTRRMAVARDAR